MAVRQMRYLNFNPFDPLQMDKMPDHNLRYVSPAEYYKLIVACRTLCRSRTLWWEVFLTVCYTTGDSGERNRTLDVGRYRL